MRSIAAVAFAFLLLPLSAQSRTAAELREHVSMVGAFRMDREAACSS